MKKNIKNYTFNTAKKIVTFNDYTNIEIEKILQISNLKTAEIIYSPMNFGDSINRKGTVSGNVLNLTFDTTSMNNSDPLQIWYDDGVYNNYDSSNNLLVKSSCIENSSATSRGQTPITIAESYFERLSKYGRQFTSSHEAVAVTQNISNTISNVFTPFPTQQKICIPEKMIISCNVDAVIKYRWFNAVINDSWTYMGAYCKAGVPLQIDYNGSIQLSASSYAHAPLSTGSIDVFITPVFQSGLAWVYGWGWLLDDN